MIFAPPLNAARLAAGDSLHGTARRRPRRNPYGEAAIVIGCLAVVWAVLVML